MVFVTVGTSLAMLMGLPLENVCAMVKPEANASRLAPRRSQPRGAGVVRAYKQRRSKARTVLERWRRLQQPVAGTAKAEGQRLASTNRQGEEKVEVMDETKGMEEFLSTGRTGRRNAMPDLGDEGVAAVSTAELPLDMAKLSCAEGGSAGTSGQPSKASGTASKQPS